MDAKYQPLFTPWKIGNVEIKDVYKRQFVNRYEGELYRVSRGGSHPVYRYGKALFLGVEL